MKEDFLQNLLILKFKRALNLKVYLLDVSKLKNARIEFLTNLHNFSI
jgi:hypothetical protein